MLIFVFMLQALLCACTFAVNQVHTEGVASDVVDETQTPSADVKLDATIPLKAL